MIYWNSDKIFIKEIDIYVVSMAALMPLFTAIAIQKNKPHILADFKYRLIPLLFVDRRLRYDPSLH